jgi:hypothetical protein
VEAGKEGVSHTAKLLVTIFNSKGATPRLSREMGERKVEVGDDPLKALALGKSRSRNKQFDAESVESRIGKLVKQHQRAKKSPCARANAHKS